MSFHSQESHTQTSSLEDEWRSGCRGWKVGSRCEESIVLPRLQTCLRRSRCLDSRSYCHLQGVRLYTRGEARPSYHWTANHTRSWIFWLGWVRRHPRLCASGLLRWMPFLQSRQALHKTSASYSRCGQMQAEMAEMAEIAGSRNGRVSKTQTASPKVCVLFRSTPDSFTAGHRRFLGTGRPAHRPR